MAGFWLITAHYFRQKEVNIELRQKKTAAATKESKPKSASRTKKSEAGKE